jgi:hypothetical protein
MTESQIKYKLRVEKKATLYDGTWTYDTDEYFEYMYAYCELESIAKNPDVVAIQIIMVEYTPVFTFVNTIDKLM